MPITEKYKYSVAHFPHRFDALHKSKEANEMTEAQQTEMHNIKVFAECAKTAIQGAQKIVRYIVFLNGVMLHYGQSKETQYNWQQAEEMHRKAITGKGAEMIVYNDYKAKYFAPPLFLSKPQAITQAEAEEIAEEITRL